MVEQRWPNLANLLGCFFNQDFDILHGSLQGALDQAVRDGSTDYRRKILREWRDWQIAVAEGDVRPWLETMGVGVLFKSQTGAREFMSELYDRLITQVRAETSKDWQP